MTAPATPKQTAYLQSLASRLPDHVLHATLADLGAPTIGDLTIATASKAITALKAIPAPRQDAPQATKPTPADLPTGIYRATDGTIYKVTPSGTSGIPIAKAYRDGTWEYSGAAHRFITADQRVSLEEAAAYGRETGNCMACGREITNPESLATGLGSVCRRKFF